MRLQESFDSINKKQKMLLYTAAILMFIFSLVLIEEREETFGLILLFLDFIYLNIILFFELAHFTLNKNKLINILKTIKTVLFYLFLILFLLGFLVISFVAITGSDLF